MKRFLAVLLSASIALSVTACGSKREVSDNKTPVPEKSAESTLLGFHVDGTKLLDGKGNEFVMRGVNHAHSWFRDKDDVALKAIADTGSNCVRIVLADGEQWQRDSVDTVKSLIESCKELDLVAIVEVHDATGYNDQESLEKAADYWIEVKDALIGNEDYVILNIANEWIGEWKSKDWKQGYTTVIPEIREAGIKNTIMVDSAGWGQYGKSIEEYGQEVFDSDPEKNTMFSIHMYGSAGGSERKIRNNLEGVTLQNLCVCVGEFGYKHSDGDVDEDYIMEYCTDNSIGYLGWSWMGNGGGVEYLDITNEWDGSALSADWGEKLINGKNGIRETSKKCTVFE